MRSDRATLGVALIATAFATCALAACLVFSGKVATELDDGAAPAEAGAVRTPDPGVYCWPGFGMPQYCPFGNACCIASGATGWFAAPQICQPDASCSGNGFDVFTCDSPFDCLDSGIADPVCCLTPMVGSTCSAASDCAKSGGGVLCNPKDPVPCPDAGTCAAFPDSSTVPPGYHACR
jgi:hypothetical protein